MKTVDEYVMILSQQHIPFEQEEDSILFKVCPLCKDGNLNARIESNIFKCDACLPDGVPVASFFSHIGVPFNADPTDFSELFSCYVEDAFDPTRTHGLSTGYPSLDAASRGFLKGHLYVLAGETGMGKSVFAINLLVNVLDKSEEKALYLDLENGKFASFTRFVSIAGFRPISFFETPENKDEALSIASRFKDKLFYFDHTRLAPYTANSSSIGMAERIGQLITSYVREHDVRIVVIDPLENFEGFETDYNAIAKVMTLFKDLAQRLGITILICHHLKKTGVNQNQTVTDLTETTTPKYRIPVVGDLIGSSKITNIATDVWAIVRQKDAVGIDRGKMLLRLLKQREGSETKDVFLMMNPENLKIAAIAYNEVPEREFRTWNQT